MQPLSPLKGETNGSQKKVKVFFEKIWKFQKLALPLQPLSASKTGRWFSKKMLKIFFKKIWKFGKVALPLQPLSASKIGERNRDQKDFGLKIQFVL